MPLPPLPDSNSDRYWLKYTYGGIEHEVCFRLGGGTTSAEGIAFANALATAMKPYLGTADSFSALRKAEKGTNLSFPLAWTAVAGTGNNPSADLARVAFVALAGRSSGGYRCRITVFCTGAYSNNDFRAPSNTAGPQAALYNVVAAASPALVAKDEAGVIWNAYVNQGFNAYWQRELR